MKCSVERLIEALIASEIARERKAAEACSAAQRRSTYVLTVSRGYGALGKETAQKLADTLGVRCCDRYILQEVAKRANVDVELVRRLDDRVNRINGNWWESLFKGRSYPKERYLQHLVKVVLNISTKGGVIVGRGAHLILGPERLERLRNPDRLVRGEKRHDVAVSGPHHLHGTSVFGLVEPEPAVLRRDLDSECADLPEVVDDVGADLPLPVDPVGIDLIPQVDAKILDPLLRLRADELARVGVGVDRVQSEATQE